MLSLVSAPVLSVCLHMLSLVLVEALVHEAVLAKSIPPIFLLPCPQNCLYSSVKTSGASTESSLLKCHYVQAVIRARLSAVLSSLSPLLPSFLGCFLAVFTWVWWRGQRQCESGDR